MDDKIFPTDFLDSDLLYRGFNADDLVSESNSIRANSIRFPDFSCNWNRLSEPADIRKRENADQTDGCYSFTVEVARYKEMATPCHDPVENNEAHAEVRQLQSEESVDFEPRKDRKLKKKNWSKSKRLEYRNNIVVNLIIELEVGESS